MRLRLRLQMIVIAVIVMLQRRRLRWLLLLMLWHDDGDVQQFGVGERFSLAQSLAHRWEDGGWWRIVAKWIGCKNKSNEGTSVKYILIS